MKNKANFCRSIIIAVLSENAGFSFKIHPKFSEVTVTELIALCRASHSGRRLISPHINWVNIVNYSVINSQLYDADKIQSNMAICLHVDSRGSSQWFMFDAKTLNITSK